MIKSVHISSFGKLKNFDKNFKPGVNLLCDRNGAGKTTLAAFVCAMFYGFPDSGRSKNPASNGRIKYAPWDNAGKFGGSMIFEKNGEIYRITREFGRTPSGDTAELRNELTNKKIETRNLGEEMFGLSYSDFVNCFFVPQEAVRLDSTDNFSRRLSEMIGGANCDTAIKKLDEQIVNIKQKRKSYGREQGRLPDAEFAEKTLEQEISDAGEKRGAIAEKETRLETVEKRRADLQNRLKELESELKEKEKAKNEYDAVNALNEAKEKDRRNSLRFLPQCDFEELPRKIDKANKLIAEKNKKYYTPVLFFVLCGVFLLSGMVCGVFTKYGVMAVLSAVGVLCGAVGLALIFKHNRNQKRLDAEIRETLLPATVIDSYGGAVNELKRIYEKYLETVSVREESKAAKPFDAAAYGVLLKKKKDLESESAELNASRAKLETEIDFLNKNLPNTAVLKEKLSETQNEINELRNRYAALVLAYDCLQTAKENLSKEYLPKMAEELSESVAEVTDGKIDRVGVSVTEATDRSVKGTEFTLTPFQNGRQYDIAYFSRGEREIALFYLKMALSKLIFGDKLPFVLIDDAFVNYGEKEFSHTAEVLKELSKKTQIIYLTCQKRGERLLTD